METEEILALRAQIAAMTPLCTEALYLMIQTRTRGDNRPYFYADEGFVKLRALAFEWNGVRKHTAVV
jgi:hypothetical protein